MKKALTMLLAVCMVCTMFAGCAKTETTSDTKSEGSTAATTTTDTSDSSSAPIKIGMIGPLTGGAADYGTSVKYGIEIAVEEINAKGGLQIEVNYMDDESDAEKALNAYNQLKDWGMQILDGTVTSTPCMAVGAEAVNDRIFLLTPSASSVGVPELGDNTFQICFTDPNQGSGSADLIAEKNLGTKIGIIYDSSDDYSSGIYESFKAEAAVLNLEIVCEEAFTSDNKSDLSTQVTKCKDAGADLVFMPFYYTEAAAVLTYANKIGYTPAFLGCDGMDGIMSVEGFDTQLAEGLMMMTPFDATSSDEATQAFVSKYSDHTGGKTPSQFAADGYDTIYAIYQACVDAGIDGNSSNEEVCEALIGQFTTMSFDGLTGTGMVWAEDGTVSKVPTAVVVKDGTYVGIE